MIYSNLRALAALLPLFLSPVARADLFIVENGVNRAEIVIAENAPRTTRLAADELQTHLEKISGAKLAVTTTPSKETIRILVGESSHARKLGLTVDDLDHGAYRMVSGDTWLALIGDDSEFEPVEPWARNNGDRKNLQALWEEASGLRYGVPNGGMYKNRRRMPPELAREEGEYFWAFDERGSYNAVCGFLRRLGVRWYLPGELGEVIPTMDSIPLPDLDETVHPDFEVRQFSVRIGNCDEEVTRWVMRLGIRNPYGLMIAHGMHTMTHPEWIKKEKPDWFALYGGKRDTELGVRLNHLCYSNEELFEETVKWARAQFDVYDFEGVSIMPPDAYTSICQCPLSEGKQIDEMGARGKLSNHVWDFANRVAREVGKTHPGKLIVCCAYGANTNPPTNIEKLEPNVQVVIVGGRRPRNSLPEQREAIRELRAGWLEKTTRPIMIFENYPFTGRGTYLPAFVARTIGESIQATKEVSRGEDIWLSFPRFQDDPNIGFDHFQIYFTARMWWGGAGADVGSLLEEYCETFYGPAGAKMMEFFDFCEKHYQAMENDVEPVETALSLFEEAKAKVAPDSIHARRIGLIDQFLDALRSKAEQLSQGRGPVPRMRTVWEPREPIVIDGKFDDEYWVRHRDWSVGRLRELQTGRSPIFGTTVMAGWDRPGHNLYLAISCEERPGEDLNITATKHDDEAIWYGDLIEILLDTDSHSYYQIEVNPAGALVDLDRGANRASWFRWESQAEVATRVEDDHWTVEIRIPVTDDENDPLNQVIGRKPSQSLPWHFNVCRQRVRENGSEHSAFSPTGSSSFHVPLKFAHFYDGRSHAFEVDENVTDFLIEFNAATTLSRGREFEGAIAAFVALSRHEGATELQKSRSLAAAAASARQLRDYDRAMELTDTIPLREIAGTAQMEILLARRQPEAIIERFGDENLEEWSFTEIGAGASARGRAFSMARQGDKAEADLQLALEFTSDPRIRMGILKTIGQNRERVLSDNVGALETYRIMVESTTNTGGADFYEAVLGATRILTGQGNHEEALGMFDKVDTGRVSGSWGVSLLLGRANTLKAAGRGEEAREMFQTVLENDSASDRQKKEAESALGSL